MAHTPEHFFEGLPQHISYVFNGSKNSCAYTLACFWAIKIE